MNNKNKIPSLGYQLIITMIQLMLLLSLKIYFYIIIAYKMKKKWE